MRERGGGEPKSCVLLFRATFRTPAITRLLFGASCLSRNAAHGRVLHASRSVTVPDGTQRERKNTRQCLLANTYQCFITPIFRFGGAEASPDRLNWSGAENNPCGFESPRDGSSAPRASRNTRAAGRGVCVVECAAFQPHAPSHLDVRQNTPTLLPFLTPFYPIHGDVIVSEQVISA